MLGKRNIFLIGPMGSGKSAVGKTLARLRGAPFYDSDVEIESRAGVDIAFIFEKEGETGFRQRECQAIDYLTRLEPIVLATGGGAVLSAENRRHLAERGYVVYLETSPTQQARRVRRNTNRPLLNNVDAHTKLTQLLKERAPLYEGIADLTVGTDGRTIRSVAEQIVRGMEASG